MSIVRTERDQQARCHLETEPADRGRDRVEASAVDVDRERQLTVAAARSDEHAFAQLPPAVGIQVVGVVGDAQDRLHSIQEGDYLRRIEGSRTAERVGMGEPTDRIGDQAGGGQDFASAVDVGGSQ